MSTYRIALSERSAAGRNFLWGGSLIASGLLLLLLIAVDVESLVLDVLRATLGFAFITIVPGYLIRSFLHVEESSTLQALLDSVGLSVLFSLLVALVLNFLLAGLTTPLSAPLFTGVLVLTVEFFVGFMLARGHADLSPRVDLPSETSRFWAGAALLTALPFLAVLGTELVNTHGFNEVTVCFIVLAALVPLLLRLRVLPSELEAYAVFCVAIGILYHTTLISPHIWGWDIHYEYHSASLIIEQGRWEPTYRSGTSSLLTVTMLSALYSQVTGLSLAWVFKALYPILFTIVPLGIYRLSKHLYDDQFVATLSPFVFVFYYGFFKVIPGKQAIAEAFLVLILLSMLTADVRSFKRRVLEVCFAAALVLSHYATALLFLLFFIGARLGLGALERVGALGDRERYELVRPTFMLLLGSLWLAWFMLTAGGLNFERVVTTMYTTLAGLFETSSGRSGAGYAAYSLVSPLWFVYVAIYVVLIGCIGAGILGELTRLYRRATIDERGEVAVLGAVVFVFLGSSVVMTYNLGFDRTLHISLVVLAPFAVLGAKWIVGLLAERTLTPSGFGAGSKVVTVVFALFLIVTLVFSSGTAFLAAGQELPRYSIGLDDQAGWPVYNATEVEGSRWVENSVPPGGQLAVFNQYSVVRSRDGLLLSGIVSNEELESVAPTRSTMSNTTYMYVSNKPVSTSADPGEYIDPARTRFASRVLSNSNVVYTSGDARVYYITPESNTSSTA